MWLYKFGKVMIHFLLMFYHRFEVHGLDRFEKEAHYIVVGNHRSNVDPIYIAAFYPNVLHFMAKKELFQNAFLRWLLPKIGAFPINREAADIGAIKRALRFLKDKESIGLFPEGTRAEKWDEAAFKQGAAYLAIKGKAEVLPAIIFGTEKAMPKGSRMIWPVKIHLLYGRPLTPEDGENIDAFGVRIRKAMEALIIEGTARGWVHEKGEG